MDHHVERVVGERKSLSVTTDELEVVDQTPGRLVDHLRALVEAHDANVEPLGYIFRDEACSGRNVEHERLRGGIETGDHLAPPPAVLPEAEHCSRPVVPRRHGIEEPPRVDLAGRRLEGAVGVHQVVLSHRTGRSTPTGVAMMTS